MGLKKRSIVVPPLLHSSSTEPLHPFLPQLLEMLRSVNLGKAHGVQGKGHCTERGIVQKQAGPFPLQKKQTSLACLGLNLKPKPAATSSPPPAHRAGRRQHGAPWTRVRRSGSAAHSPSARPAPPLPAGGTAAAAGPSAPSPVPFPPAEHADGPEEQGGGGGRPAAGAERQRLGAHRLRWGRGGKVSPVLLLRAGAERGRPALPAHQRARGAGFGCSELNLASGARGEPAGSSPGSAPRRGGSRPPAPGLGAAAGTGKQPARDDPGGTPEGTRRGLGTSRSPASGVCGGGSAPAGPPGLAVLGWCGEWGW